VWDAQTGQELLTLKGASGPVMFSPDGKHLASAIGGIGTPPWQGGPVGEVKVWDAQTGQELLTLKGASGRLVFSPDGKRLVSALRGPWTLKVWDAQTGQQLLSLKGHTNDMGIIAFSPDGHRLAGTASDGTVKIYDATPLPGKP
jgi:WD40 repeat protein